MSLYFKWSKRCFLHFIWTSRNCPSSLPSLPTTLFVIYLQVSLPFWLSPAIWMPPLSLHWNDSPLPDTLQIQRSFFNSHFRLDPSKPCGTDNHSLILKPPSAKACKANPFLLHLRPFFSDFYRLSLFSLIVGDLEGWVLDSFPLWFYILSGESHHSLRYL